jgi:hypothetical protein
MANQSPYQKNFPFPEAYDFLTANGLAENAHEIRNSRDKFMSFQTKLKRAKIIVLVKEEGHYEKFLDEVWPSGRTAKGERRALTFANLYQRWYESAQGREAEEVEEEEEEVDELDEARFEREIELRDFLANNLHSIEPGLQLKQKEFVIPDTQRRIDILCEDKHGTPVIVELKVGRGHERVIGQAAYYQQSIKSVYSAPRVRVIIIAKELSEELKVGAMGLRDFELYEYQLSMTVNRVTAESSRASNQS